MKNVYSTKKTWKAENALKLTRIKEKQYCEKLFSHKK